MTDIATVIQAIEAGTVKVTDYDAILVAMHSRRVAMVEAAETELASVITDQTSFVERAALVAHLLLTQHGGTMGVADLRKLVEAHGNFMRPSWYYASDEAWRAVMDQLGKGRFELDMGAHTITAVAPARATA